MNIRKMTAAEYPLLEEFLYNAIFIPEGVEKPPHEIIQNAELQVYIKDFGKRKDDHCLVAENDSKVIAACWVRIMDDYGHIDDETRSFAISVLEEYRGKGTGTELIGKCWSCLKPRVINALLLRFRKRIMPLECTRKSALT